MLDLTIRPEIGVIAVGMLDIPVEIVGIRSDMRLPFVLGRIEIAILIATRGSPQPVRARWHIGMPATPQQLIPGMLGGPGGLLSSRIRLSPCHPDESLRLGYLLMSPPLG
jgi:hypothetical protein